MNTIIVALYIAFCSLFGSNKDAMREKTVAVSEMKKTIISFEELITLPEHDSKSSEQIYEEFYMPLIKTRKTAVIKFFVPNCGVCLSMIPAWEKLAEELSAKEIQFFEVNAEIERLQYLCDAMNLDYIPSIVVIKEGVLLEKRLTGQFNYTQLSKEITELLK